MKAEAKSQTKFIPVNPGTAFTWWLTIVIIGLLALMVTLLAPQIIGIPIKPGDMIESNIVSSHLATFVDEIATNQTKELARQSVLQVFKRDPEVDEQIMQNLKVKLDAVAKLQTDAHLPLNISCSPDEQAYIMEMPDSAWTRMKLALINYAQKHKTTHVPETIRPGIETNIFIKLSRKSAFDINNIIESSRINLKTISASNNHDLLFLAVSVSPNNWQKMCTIIESATKKLLELGPLFPDVARSDWEREVLEFLPDNWRDVIRWSCARVVASVLEPNVVVNTQATKQKADAAANAVPLQTKIVKPGQIIAYKRQPISPETAEILKKLGITKITNWPLVFSIAISLIAAAACFGLFLNSYAPKLLFSVSSIGIMFTLSIVTCVIADFIGQDLPQFVPLSAAALVATIFFGPKVASALIVLTAIFLQVDSLVTTNNLLALLMASIVALGANIKQRIDLVLRGLLIGVIQALTFLACAIISHNAMPAAVFYQQILLQLLGGISSCIVAVGSLPLFENLFGMVTPFRIAELASPDQPLLRQLEEKAPGTYQHSLAVANLAEAGARAIGADANLVRAGSLYHDIGKMARPRYFIENQLGDTNPHDSITPEESRDRVLAHVTDGLVFAQKSGLPKAVQDFVPQHQGTTVMAYFYHKACVRDGADNVDMDFYRYPGPKPQSKEAAIVMLADVSEAVTHSLHDPTQEEVETQMNVVFKARWLDGQFIESGLTKDELRKIRNAFVRVWRTLHHERLKYPATTTGRMPVPPSQFVPKEEQDKG